MPRIILRTEWGARHAAAWKDLDAPLPAREVYLHHSVTIAPDLVPPFDDDDAAVRTLEDIGQQRFGWGISYSFVVTPSGRIYEGHRINGVGSHTGGRNSISRAICLIGNYETARPTPAQLDAVAWLLAYGADPLVGWWTAPRLTGGHRDVPGASTECPGDNAWLAIPAINGQAARTNPRTDSEGNDMPLSEDDLIKIRDIVWRAPVPDFYGPNLPDLPAYVALGYATSHGAHARDEAAAGRTAVGALNSTVAGLPDRLADGLATRLTPALGQLQPGGGLLTVDEVRALLRQALDDIGPLYLTADRYYPDQEEGSRAPA